MKILLLLFLLISGTFYAQEIEKLECLSKKNKCWITVKDGYYGLVKDGVVLEPNQFLDYQVYEDVVVMTGETTGSVCYTVDGKQLIDLPQGVIEIEPMEQLIIAMLEGRSTIFTRSGLQIIPYGDYSYEPYETAVIVKNEQTGEKGLFDYQGKALVPFSPNDITYEDYGQKIIAVRQNSVFTIMMSDDVPLLKNTSVLDDFTFVSNSEVSVGDYLTFLGNQRLEGLLNEPGTSDILDVRKLFPDTTKVEAKLLPVYRYALNVLLSENVAEHPGEIQLSKSVYPFYVPYTFDKKMKPLLDFPVTGVTKWQAEQYCNWLSMQLTNQENFPYASTVISLPTDEQWELMAQQALRPENVQKQAPDSLNAKNCMLIIYNSLVECKNYESYLKASLGGGSVAVKTMNLDMSGRAHVYGNVAEMTQTEGVAKGGSFDHPAKEATVSGVIPYTVPEPWLGFRVVGQFKIL